MLSDNCNLCFIVVMLIVPRVIDCKQQSCVASVRKCQLYSEVIDNVTITFEYHPVFNVLAKVGKRMQAIVPRTTVNE